MDISILLTALSVISVVAGLGWKLSQYLADIRIMVAEIKAILQATSARMDRIEVEVRDIDNRLRKMENTNGQ